MFRKFLHFVLHSRLENVLAVVVPLALLAFFSFSRLLFSFHFGMLDFIFILLPIGLLGAKYLLTILASSGNPTGEDLDPLKYSAKFFKPLLKIFQDWFPFFLLSACYYSLYTNLILRVNPHTADASLAKIDALIFGDQPSILLQRWINPWLTDFFSLIYFSHALFLPGMALYFYLSKDSKAFRTIMMGYLTLLLMGITSYLFLPAVGPMTFIADRFTQDLHGQILSKGVDYIINVGRISHDCFPSLHVAIPLLLTLYLRDYRKKFFIPALLYVTCMSAATVYLRYHYFIDVVASFVYAPAAYCLNNFMLAHWPGEKLAVSAVGSELLDAQKPAPGVSNATSSDRAKE